MWGEPGLCECRRRLRGEFELAGRSLRYLRSLSCFGLAHRHHEVVQKITFLESFEDDDGGAVLRLLKRPSSFLFVSLIVYCPKHAPGMQRVICSCSGERSRLCCEAESLAVVSS